MALEIERRFFVCSEAWRELVQRSEQLDQGYLSQGGQGVTVRVRSAGDQAWLTLKASTADPEVRQEFEYAIPSADANALLALTPRRVQKLRHHLKLEGGEWVVDEFSG
ncbi:MAG: CYTH domain-containing protein, partial [Synechococcus sp.]|nr:CYTH domain-containing protein [Synechococcus sp.]